MFRTARMIVALALKWTGSTPQVTAQGMGEAAHAIIKKAKESGVPVIASEELGNLYSEFSLYENIPKECYALVAQIYIFLNKRSRS